MTYRKLFLLVLAISTVLLGALWWRSLTRFHFFTYAPPKFVSGNGIACSLYPVSLEFTFGPSVYWPEGLDFQTHASSSRLVTTNHYQGYFGHFAVDRSRIVGWGPRVRHFYSIEFPIWVPWILLVGGAYLLMRRQEKRPARLAGEAAAEQASGRD